MTGSSPNVSIESGSTLGDIYFASLSLTGLARKGRWVIGADLIYLDISDEKSDVSSVDFKLGPGSITIATTEIYYSPSSAFLRLSYPRNNLGEWSLIQ